MSEQQICPQGHQWQTSVEHDGPGLCPVCGAPPLSPSTPDNLTEINTSQPAPDRSSAPTLPLSKGETPKGLIPGYELLAEIGRGGMGVVFKARQTKLNRIVALKMIIAGAYAGETELARFRAEAEAIARLQHTNIVQIFEIGECDSLPYFSLEYCDGGSLDQILVGTPLPAEDAAALVEQLARAVHVAHERGILHRDLKPANVLLASSSGKSSEKDEPSALRTALAHPKITDFGLARNLGEVGQTRSGAIVGTPSYMAPEQAAGKGREVGPRADLYALGAILYECLTGRPPFKGASDADTLVQVLTTEPVSPRRLQPNLSADLEAVCLKCLEKDPARRYAGTAELADDLKRFREGAATVARPIGPVTRLVRWARRNPAVASLIATVAFLLITTAVVSSVLALRLAAAREDAEKYAADEAEQRKKAEGLAERERGLRADADRSAQAAKAAKEEAERERGQTEAALYLSSLTLAANAWENNDSEGTEQHLDDCPPERAHWEHRFLKGLCRSGLSTVTLPNPESGRRIALSRDGSRAAVVNYVRSGSGPFRFRNWSVEVCLTQTGQTYRSYHVNGGIAISDVALSPNGKYLALAEGTHVVLWDVENQIALSSLEHNALAMEFSPDGRVFAFADTEGVTRIIEVPKGQTTAVLPRQTREAVAVCVSPDGSLAATGGADGIIRIWPLAGDPKAPARFERTVRHTMTGHRGTIQALSFSADGKRLASAGQDGTLRHWDAVTGKELQMMRGHNGPVQLLALSPDGTRVATAGEDRAIRVWDKARGETLFVLRGHSAPIRSLVYTPDGKRLISVSEDGKLRTWDAETGGQGVRLNANATRAVFSPDGKQIATASEATLRIWDVATGKQQVVLEGHANRVVSLAWTADGKSIAAVALGDQVDGQSALEIKLWDIASRTAIHTIRRQVIDVPVVHFAGDGTRAIVPLDEKRVTILDTRTGKTVPRLPSWHDNDELPVFSTDGLRLATITTLEPGAAVFGSPVAIELRDNRTGETQAICTGQPGKVRVVAFSASGPHAAGPFLAVAGSDDTVRIWDATPAPDGGQGKLAARLPLHILRGHSRPVRSLAFSPDARRLATVSSDDTGTQGEIKLWDLVSGKVLLTIPRAGRDVAFHPDGMRLAVCCGDGSVWLWEGRARPEIVARRRSGSSVSFDPDGQRLALAGASDSVILWDVRRGSVVGRLQGLSEGSVTGHTQLVRQVVYGPGGRTLVTFAADNTVKVWNAETLKVVQTFREHTETIHAVALHPDGKTAASAGADEVVRVWDVATGKQIALFKDHGERVLTVAFNHDGTYLASGGDDNAVLLWQVKDGEAKLIRRFGDGHKGAVNSVAFSPNGALLASGGDDNVIRVWDVQTGREVSVLRGHIDGVRHLAFSRDGKRLATAGWDRTVKLWDVAEVRELRSFSGHEAGVLSVSFGLHWLASADSEATMRIWDLR